MICEAKVNKRKRSRTNSLLVLAERGVNDAHVKKNLGSIRDLLELLEGFVKFIVVVVGQRGHPRFDFLYGAKSVRSVTCTRDIALALKL